MIHSYTYTLSHVFIEYMRSLQSSIVFRKTAMPHGDSFCDYFHSVLSATRLNIPNKTYDIIAITVGCNTHKIWIIFTISIVV
jgi:hypothetical protein